MSLTTHYANEMCSVKICDDSPTASLYFAVADNDGMAMYSQNINIYWLIGVLTYQGYIDKNYKK